MKDSVNQDILSEKERNVFVCTRVHVHFSVCRYAREREMKEREREREEKMISVKIMVFSKEKALNVCNSVF